MTIYIYVVSFLCSAIIITKEDITKRQINVWNIKETQAEMSLAHNNSHPQVKKDRIKKKEMQWQRGKQETWERGG